MRGEHPAFDELAESSEQIEQWLDRRAKAKRYVDALGDATVIESLARRLESGYQADGELPGYDSLQELVLELLASVGIAEDDAALQGHREETTEIVSRALALFVTAADPSIERLAAVSKIEFFLDIPLVAEQVAAGNSANEWLTVLRKLEFTLSSINDDEYQASDELERWRKELSQPVPSWHEGDFPRMERSVERLVSGLLRVLDEHRWLEFLDRLPIAALMESLLWDAHVERSPAVVLNWIRGAPLAFDKLGARTTAALIFILERRAYGLIENHIIHRVRWAEGTSGIDEAIRQVDSAREELAAAISSRPDGRELLAELGALHMDRAQASAP